MGEAVEIRLYEEGDELGITRLFHEVFRREMSLEEWRWKYTGRGNKKVYSAVAVTESDRIVAHYGGIPLQMIYYGKPLKGLSIGDVMIRPQYRGLRTFKRLTHSVEDLLYREGFQMVFGFPTEKTLMLPAEKLGLYERVEDVVEFSKEARVRNNPDRFIYEFFPMRFYDETLDELWETVKKEFRIAVVRDRRYFIWRYENHPLCSYEIWGLRLKATMKLLALAVLRKDGDRLLIVDLLFRYKCLAALLENIENLSMAMGKKTLCLWLPSYLHQWLLDKGFSARPHGTSIPCTTHPGFLTKDDIRGNFFYTMGDTDFL